jgi:hypothetical protein
VGKTANPGVSPNHMTLPIRNFSTVSFSFSGKVSSFFVHSVQSLMD